MWEGKEIKVQGKLATATEREKLRSWAKEHDLVIAGDLEHEATIVADQPEQLQKALTELVKKEVGAVGYLIYGVNKRGKGKVIAHRSEVKLEDFTEVARLPQVKGG